MDPIFDFAEYMREIRYLRVRKYVHEDDGRVGKKKYVQIFPRRELKKRVEWVTHR